MEEPAIAELDDVVGLTMEEKKRNEVSDVEEGKEERKEGSVYK